MGFMVILSQVALMFAMMALGLFGAKKRWISNDAIIGMTNVLVYFVNPCVIVSAFHRPFSWSQLHDLSLVTLISAGSYVLLIPAVALLYSKVADPDRRRALKFGAVYANVGFFGIPLAQALLGADGVFYVVISVVFFNVFAWTHGWAMFPGERKSPLKQLFSNPALPSVLIGLVLFFTSVQLPDIVAQGLSYMTAINAPLSMIVIGANLAAVAWSSFLKDVLLWVGSAVRTIAVPLIGILVLWPIPLPVSARLAILIALGCPVGAYLVMFSVMRNAETTFPTRLVCLSTLMCLVTLPASLTLANLIW
ncbi:MAG: AEC family transporter [Propionibacteriaceae bacterium]|jgi:predicted permease|nr:AEC family transporter [Propionibacteriaceae bacterium]